MPINKPTIAHQLKTIKNSKSRQSSVILSSPNVVAATPFTRSHLRGRCPQWQKSSYEKGENAFDSGDMSHTDLKQCTRILRNVLANEATNQNIIRDKKNKSTSTDDSLYQDRFVSAKLVGFKSPDNSVSNCPERLHTTGETVDEETEADSLTSTADPKFTLNNNTNPSQRSSVIKPQFFQQTSQSQFCTCETDNNNNNRMPESKRLSGSGDCARTTPDKSAICVRCHNIIPQTNNYDKDCTKSSKNLDPGSGYDRFVDKHSPKSFVANSHSEYVSPVHYDNIGDETIDTLVAQLQMKVNEIGLIARATRDADLDRLVSEIDRAFQQMIRENALVFNHLKTITKTLKWDNSGLKQKIKSQSESNRDLKSEMKLLRIEQKQKIEELRLELQLKEEEVRQLSDKDRSSVLHWKDKYHNLEKEHEKVRGDLQTQILLACQKDTEMIQLKHLCTQAESKLKEQIHSLQLSQQNLQSELTKSQETLKKYDQECQHNQTVIKAAREHVINLLDRHKNGRDATSSSVSYRFDSLCDTPQNGSSGDWVNQATSLQQVLSMVSDGRDGQRSLSNTNSNNIATCGNFYSKSYENPARSITISPINFATTNYNNNYISSSTCNPNISDSSKRMIDSDGDFMKYSNEYPGDFSVSRSPSEISSTISHNSISFSQRNTKENVEGSLDDKSVPHGGRHSADIVFNDTSWNLDLPQKAKMSSASSVMSTVSSLRSTDDRDFRSGLQRLDSQINRLQTTLQSKLLCK